MKTVAGIPLQTFEEPVRDALKGYSDRTDGRVTFDIEPAAQLDFVEGKLTARSATTIHHLGERAGTLYVIAFAPFDGTGDEGTYKISDLDFFGWRQNAALVPRSKIAAHSEAHLTVASFALDEPTRDPMPNLGHLDMLGIKGENGIARLGYVGHSKDAFHAVLNGEIDAGPRATFTVGYDNGERYGDPHSIYNTRPEAVQVCGFIAISPADALQHADILRSLGAVQPDLA